jgi:rhodanese-related sulfurtransferase
MDGTVDDADPTPEIGTAELRQALAASTVVILDARPREEYGVSHIPGALSVAGKSGLPPSLYTADVTDVARMVPDRSTALVVYCNGLYCGRSKRFAADLAAVGYTDVRRYQLGIPAWRGLGGVTQVDKDALLRLLRLDRTAELIDAREHIPEHECLRGATSIPLAETTAAKDDGRLPMNDHNTRIFVVGEDAEEAKAVAEAIVKDAFHNVSFYAGSARELLEIRR